MKNRTIIIFLLIFGQLLHAQKKQCFCEKDTLMNNATVDCQTIKLKDNSKLYWQFNCNRIWLTLENNKGKKTVLDEGDITMYSYTYRLNYHLIKEYNNSILFRTGCSANGPCSYVLVEKSNGNKLEEFGQLICIDTDSQWDKESHKYNFNFIVYLSNDSDHLVVYFIDSKQKIKVPFKEELTSIIPEQQFYNMELKNNVLTLFYELDNNVKKSVKINIEKKKHIR